MVITKHQPDNTPNSRTILAVWGFSGQFRVSGFPAKRKEDSEYIKL